MKILLLSDTHSHLEAALEKKAGEVDEVWHAGDFGSHSVAERLAARCPMLRGVYGNIDDTEIRRVFPETNEFTVCDIRVMMRHIGGHPERYARGVARLLRQKKPHIFVCGHSHILRVVDDEKYKVLHLNPGACGRVGIHLVKTALYLELGPREVKAVEVIDLGPR